MNKSDLVLRDEEDQFLLDQRGCCPYSGTLLLKASGYQPNGALKPKRDDLEGHRFGQIVHVALGIGVAVCSHPHAVEPMYKTYVISH